MSLLFREFIKKVGSGPHTSENLSRSEAADATRMMLLQEATPAQIGAFMIAHRIKRPTGVELAGMLDAYDQLGPKLQSCHRHSSPPIILGIPYDGRSRTAPINILTALLLIAAEQAVIMHGSDRAPTKYGVPLIEIWQSLGVNFAELSLVQTQQIFESTGMGFVYINKHFPLAAGLFPYREQIAKRSPFSTMELIWRPYAGEAHIFAGFVHPPTENMFRDAFALRGNPQYFTTIKGLEGSGDLPRDRTAIIGLGGLNNTFERLHLAHHDYGISSKNPPLEELPKLVESIHSVLQGEPSEMMQSAIWNGGFYLWRCGVSSDMKSGMDDAKNLFNSGKPAQKLQKLSQLVMVIHTSC